MLLMKRGCRGKKLKQIFKTEPIPDLQIIHEEEPTLIQTKKYLIQLNKETDQHSSLSPSRRKQFQFDFTLAEWNHRHETKVEDEHQQHLDLNRLVYWKNSNSFHQTSERKVMRQHQFDKDKLKLVTSRYKFNSTEVQKIPMHKQSLPINYSVMAKDRKSEECKPIMKSLYVKQYQLILKNPIDRKIINKISNNRVQSIQFSREQQQKQKLPKLDKLHHAKSQQHKKNYNFIFHRKKKNKHFQLSIHSPLIKDITKISQLIKQQIVNAPEQSPQF